MGRLLDERLARDLGFFAVAVGRVRE